jgi:hypothetical protein
MDPLLDDQNQVVPRAPSKERRREERPKNNPKEDLGYRIKGLEAAKMEPGMSPQDIAALDRSIAKLKEKQAEKSEPKKED